MRTISEVNRNPYIREEQMQVLCRQFGIYGKYAEYHLGSENSLAGVYFVCGAPDKVEEIVANSDSFHNVARLDPSWVSLREDRHPGFFYTDAFAINVSNMSPVVAYAEIGDYCRTYEAVRTIFKEFGKPLPKKIPRSEVVSIVALNEGRYNEDYPVSIQKKYTEALKEYMDKKFSRFREPSDELSPIVSMDYFEKGDASIKFVTLSEKECNLILSEIDKNPQKYGDLKIYLGRKFMLGDKAPESKSLSEYNPWRNSKSVDVRRVAYRECDEALISRILASPFLEAIDNATLPIEDVTTKSCHAITFPFNYLLAFDEFSKEEQFKYYLDSDHLFSEPNSNEATVVVPLEHAPKLHTFLSGVIKDVNEDHALGPSQRYNVDRGVSAYSSLDKKIEEAKSEKGGIFSGVFNRKKDYERG